MIGGQGSQAPGPPFASRLGCPAVSRAFLSHRVGGRARDARASRDPPPDTPLGQAVGPALAQLMVEPHPSLPTEGNST
jgi:hypothetical protein